MVMTFIEVVVVLLLVIYLIALSLIFCCEDDFNPSSLSCHSEGSLLKLFSRFKEEMKVNNEDDANGLQENLIHWKRKKLEFNLSCLSGITY